MNANKNILVWVSSVVFTACSGGSKFSTRPQQAPVKAEEPLPSPQPTPVEVVASPSNADVEAVVAKDYSIQFKTLPANNHNSIKGDFEIEGQNEISSVVYKLDDKAEIEVPGKKFDVFSFYGPHKISVTAKFSDGGKSSNTLTYNWNVNAGGFVTRDRASHISGSEYRLTEGQKDQVGMVVSENKIVFRWVEINFSVRFNNLDPVLPADGISFGITEKSRDEVQPAGGGGIGFFGTGGFGVELDLFNNNEEQVPHITLVRDGRGQVATPVFFPSLTSGEWIPIKVCVEEGGLFSVIANSNKIFNRVQMPDFPTGRNFEGHIFLSAATGIHYAEQRVRMDSVSYNVAGAPQGCN